MGNDVKETTGIDIAEDRAIEIAATHSPDDVRSPGGSFCTVVSVDPQVLEERGAEAEAVHGISAAESAQGPNFIEAWRRFLQWTDALLQAAVVESPPDTDDEEPREPRMPDEPPVLLLAAHNGVRFDFPLLLFELLRHNLPCESFERWLFVDTLDVVRMSKKGCLKLRGSVVV